MVLAKKVKGLLPEKKYIKESSAVYMPFEDEGFNKAIDQIGNKNLTLDREKLARVIYDSEPKVPGMMSDFESCKVTYLRQSDAVILNLKDLLLAE